MSLEMTIKIISRLRTRKSATPVCRRARRQSLRRLGAGRCFALEERKMRAWGGAETLFCAQGAQNACFLECCFAPGGRKRRIFRFDEA